MYCGHRCSDNYCYCTLFQSRSGWVMGWFWNSQKSRILPSSRSAQENGRRTGEVTPVLPCILQLWPGAIFCTLREKNAWKTWQVFNKVTKDFSKLSQTPSKDEVNATMPVLERFMSLMYCTSGQQTAIRWRTWGGNDLSRMTETLRWFPLLRQPIRSKTKEQHLLLAVWGQHLVTCPVLSSPEEWDWKISDGKHVPYWTTLPQASLAIPDLIKCGCHLWRRDVTLDASAKNRTYLAES